MTQKSYWSFMSFKNEFITKNVIYKSSEAVLKRKGSGSYIESFSDA